MLIRLSIVFQKISLLEELENDLIFTGLIGMIDPERPEAAEAVRVAKEAESVQL